MKFRNIFFGFLKTWLLIAIFYSGSLYAAGYMFLTLYDYQPITNNFRPYFFEKDPYTGKLTKVFDAENDFQFETYTVGSEADMALYKERVLPVLNDWGSEVEDYKLGTDSRTSAHLTEFMKLDVTIDSGSEDATVLTREVHVATYKGEIEAMSYSDSSEAGVPKITTLIAKPKGLVPSQTTTVKGGGSSLLERLVQRYKAKYVDKIRLYSAQDDYYSKRGWKNEPESDSESESESEGACGNG
ncbi:hypothetical protein [uncultured Gammaproteobacteria bacterium]|nr:hypothetical protein [uncultured Gammaproteobacteria bacterium]